MRGRPSSFFIISIFHVAIARFLEELIFEGTHVVVARSLRPIVEPEGTVPHFGVPERSLRLSARVHEAMYSLGRGEAKFG